MKETEKAWAAGFIDGEGYFGFHTWTGRNGRNYSKPILKVIQKKVGER